MDELIERGLLSPDRREGDFLQPLLFNIPAGSVADIEVVEKDSNVTWGHGALHLRFNLPDGDTFQLNAYPDLFSDFDTNSHEGYVRDGDGAELALNQILSTTPLALNVDTEGTLYIGTQRDHKLNVAGVRVRTQTSGLIRNQRLKENNKQSPAILNEWAARLDSTEDHLALLKDNPLYYLAHNADLPALEEQGSRVGHNSMYGNEPRLMVPKGAYTLHVERVGAVDQLVIGVGGANIVTGIDSGDPLDMLNGDYTLYIDADGDIFFASDSRLGVRPTEYSAVPLPSTNGPSWLK